MSTPEPGDLDIRRVVSELCQVNCHICKSVGEGKKGSITADCTTDTKFWEICTSCINTRWRIGHPELQSWEEITYERNLYPGGRALEYRSIAV